MHMERFFYNVNTPLLYDYLLPRFVKIMVLGMIPNSRLQGCSNPLAQRCISLYHISMCMTLCAKHIDKQSMCKQRRIAKGSPCHILKSQFCMSSSAGKIWLAAGHLLALNPWLPSKPRAAERKSPSSAPFRIRRVSSLSRSNIWTCSKCSGAYFWNCSKLQIRDCACASLAVLGLYEGVSLLLSMAAVFSKRRRLKKRLSLRTLSLGEGLFFKSTTLLDVCLHIRN
jgi:hypothetical protein